MQQPYDDDAALSVACSSLGVSVDVGVISAAAARVDRRLTALLRLQLETPIEHLDVGEDALPVRALHTHHVFDVQQRRYARHPPVSVITLPLRPHHTITLILPPYCSTYGNFI